MVFGFAPGKLARTTTVGGTTSGYSLIGRFGSASAPPIRISSDNTAAKMGRLMKNCERFMAGSIARVRGLTFVIAVVQRGCGLGGVLLVVVIGRLGRRRSGLVVALGQTARVVDALVHRHLARLHDIAGMHAL